MTPVSEAEVEIFFGHPTKDYRYSNSENPILLKVKIASVKSLSSKEERKKREEENESKTKKTKKGGE